MSNRMSMGNGDTDNLQLVLLTQIYNDDSTLTELIATLQDKPGTAVQSINPGAMNDSDWDDLLQRVLKTPKVIVL